LGSEVTIDPLSAMLPSSGVGYKCGYIVERPTNLQGAHFPIQCSCCIADGEGVSPQAPDGRCSIRHSYQHEPPSSPHVPEGGRVYGLASAILVLPDHQSSVNDEPVPNSRRCPSKYRMRYQDSERLLETFQDFKFQTWTRLSLKPTCYPMLGDHYFYLICT
jgi:hypothetical protein